MPRVEHRCGAAVVEPAPQHRPELGAADVGHDRCRLVAAPPPRFGETPHEIDVLPDIERLVESAHLLERLGSHDEHPPQVSCWITHTRPDTHELIRAALDRSPEAVLRAHPLHDAAADVVGLAVEDGDELGVAITVDVGGGGVLVGPDSGVPKHKRGWPQLGAPQGDLHGHLAAGLGGADADVPDLDFIHRGVVELLEAVIIVLFIVVVIKAALALLGAARTSGRRRPCGRGAGACG